MTEREFIDGGQQLAVLLLDDDDENRSLSVQLFESENMRVVEASSYSEAERELISHPGIDCVSLDVSLRGGGRDKEGAELAVRIRRAHADLPIIGYSAFFGESDLTAEERGAFTAYFERAGDTEDIDAYVDRCLEEGQAYRQRRRASFISQIEVLAKRGQLGEREHAVLRTFSLESSLEPSLERALLDAGYLVKVILPTAPDGEHPAARRPIVVWVRQIDENVEPGEAAEFEAEVFGQPLLYGIGPDVDGAIQNMMDVFWLFVGDLSGTSHDELDGPALSLAHFFEHVLKD